MTEHGPVTDHRTELFIIIGRRACRSVIDLSFVIFSQHFVLQLEQVSTANAQQLEAARRCAKVRMNC